MYLERFPTLTDRRLISADGGLMPIWSPDGREVFYMSDETDRIMVANIDAESGIREGPPRVLVDGTFYEFGVLRTYDVTPDGQHLVVLTFAEDRQNARRPHLIVVQNWLSEH